MAHPQTVRPAPAAAGNRPRIDRLGGAIDSDRNPTDHQKQLRHRNQRAQPRITTPRGGTHLFFRWREGMDLSYEAAEWAGLSETVGDDFVLATVAAAFANARRP
jgi:hypothetical protein